MDSNQSCRIRMHAHKYTPKAHRLASLLCMVFLFIRYIYIYRCVHVCVYPRFKVKFCFHNILSISARAFFYLVFARVSPFRPSACLCFVCLFRVYAELCIYWSMHEYTCLALKIIIKKKEREQTSEKRSGSGDG